MTRPRLLLALALAVPLAGATVLPAAPARAQAQAQLLLAQQWFDEGIKLERAGKWPEALAQFKKALDVKRTAAVQFHVGMCEARVGLLADAAVDLARAIELAKAADTPTNQKVLEVAESELREVRPRIPTLEITAAPGSKPVKVLLDGQPLALSVLGTAMPVNPGEHEVTIEFAHGSTQKKVKLAAKDAQRLTVEAPPEPAPDARVAPRPPEEPRRDTTPPPPHEKDAPRSTVLPWTLVAVGGAGIVVGGVFFFLWQDNLSTLDRVCPTRVGCSGDYRSEDDAGRRNNLISWIAGGVGLAALGTGVGMLVLGGGKAPAASGKAQIVPVALPGGAGAVVTGRL